MNTNTLNTWQIIDAFAAAIAGAGLGAPDIVADGKLHRFRTTDDKPGKRSGWYSLHLDRFPAGVFGDWRTGLTETWCAKDREQMTGRDRADIRTLVEQAKRQHQAEREAQHRTAADKALAIWTHCIPAPADHPYLIAKGVHPHGTRQDRHGNLIVPASDGETLTTLQFIGPDGSKRFLTGGRIAGCWCAIPGDRPGPLLIGEGFATTATLRQETGCPAVVAFNAGNLLPVAKTIRRLNPHDDLVICGDDDQWTEGNPGRTKARKAAVEVNAKLLMPDFTGLDLSGKPTDWNDWYRLRAEARRVAP